VQRRSVSCKDVVGDSRRIIALMEVFLDEADKLDQVLGQQDLQLLEPARADPAAKRNDRAFADAACLGKIRHRHVNDDLGSRDDQRRDLPGLGRKIRLQFSDTGQDGVHFWSECRRSDRQFP
jgi:hypothetical protein